MPDRGGSATDRVLDAIAAIDKAHGPRELNAAIESLNALADDPEVLPAIYEHRAKVLATFNSAKTEVAGAMARLAGATLLLSTPDTAIEHRADLVGGPAAEVALAAFHILRYAGDVIPLDPDEIEAALEPSDADPVFSDYPVVFAAAVAHLHTAAYYLLNPEDAYQALASAPPEQETFPPLPFPRIWIEMTHLAPYMRFRQEAHTLDFLGVGIAEIQQGRVWDIYLPFDYDASAEFFFLAGRISPGEVIDADPSLVKAEWCFRALRDLAVGGVHLITARNVETSAVTLPRHQRKRIAATRRGRDQPRVYFVDLARAGEHEHVAQTGKREYHFRWLVRGHWRHIDAGRSFCTCCDPPQIASWVEPYVKGPVGVPWKGRQLRRQL